MIDDTVALQYRIALYASGMVDGPPGRLTTSERLSLLRSYETSWKNLDWNEQTSLPIPVGNLWELYGNVWAHSRGDDSIDFVQIPSRLRGIPLRQWALKLDSPIRDFTMDPSQDLLVTIGRATKYVWLTFGRMMTYGYLISSALLRCRIRLLALSTGGEHRLAKDATFEHLPALPRVQWSHSIRISGDYFGILFITTDDDDDDDDENDEGNELVVWNWKTGVEHLVSECHYLRYTRPYELLKFQRITLIGMISFIFLGNDFVLASTSTSPPLDYEQPSLLLYSIGQRLVPSPDAPDSHLLRFLFPAGRPTHGHTVIALTSDPSLSWSTSPTLQVPFEIPHDERTIAFSRLYRGTSHNETFLMPASTLLRHIGDSKIGDEGRDIQWESWLPKSVVPRQGRWSSYTCFVFGMRHILPKAALRDETRVMIVRDLCPRRYMRASEEEREESTALHRVMGSLEPDPRSIVKCVPLPRSISDSSIVDLMISEDGIVALEVRCMRGLHLYAARLLMPFIGS